MRKWSKSSQKTRFFVQCDHFRKKGAFYSPFFPVPLQKLGGGLKHINVRIELKQTLRCYRLDSHKGLKHINVRIELKPFFSTSDHKAPQVLKHINVRIELKHIELISNRATYWRIKAYQCSYRTETSNCSHRAGLGRY